MEESETALLKAAQESTAQWIRLVGRVECHRGTVLDLPEAKQLRIHSLKSDVRSWRCEDGEKQTETRQSVEIQKKGHVECFSTKERSRKDERTEEVNKSNGQVCRAWRLDDCVIQTAQGNEILLSCKKSVTLTNSKN